MFRLPGQSVGDAWFFREPPAGPWHLYALTCPSGVPRHERWWVTHATSDDLISWEHLGEVVAPPEAAAWDAGCLATGGVAEHPAGGGRYVLAHTVRHAGPDPAVKLLAGDDLHAWHPVGIGPAARLADAPGGWYGQIGTGERSFPHFRDPFLFVDDGELHCLCTAARADGPADGRGTVAHLVWRDTRFEFLPPPEMPAVAQEPECPHLYDAGGGRWLLVFSSAGQWFTADFRRGRDLPTGTYAMAGPSPLGPWSEPRPLRPAAAPPGLYAARLLDLDGRPVLIGTVGDTVCDPIDAREAVAWT